jgi:hypothetical protein
MSHHIAEFVRRLRRELRPLGLPEYVLFGSLLVVLGSFLLFYAIDLKNVFGLRDWLHSGLQPYFYFTYFPFFFQHWGRNSGFAELIQWSLLGGSLLLSAFVAGRYYLQDKTRFTFFALMALALLLMLLEDAGNIRHTLMSYVQVFADEPDQGIIGTLFEAGYFLLLGGLPLYALVRYGRVLVVHAKAFTYLVAGFGLYFLAGSLSFIGTAFSGLLDRDLYTLAGERFSACALRWGDAELAVLWEAWNTENPIYPIGFFLMDSLVEENIEILGAAAFLAAMLAFTALALRGSLPRSSHERDDAGRQDARE